MEQKILQVPIYESDAARSRSKQKMASPASSRVLRGRLAGYARALRLLKVYLTLVRVGFSYLWVSLAAMPRGKNWKAQRLPEVHRKCARRVEKVILDVKGLFVKVGQILSIMTNFLPKEFCGELEGVQDKVPPCTGDDIKTRIREELGSETFEMFASIDEHPVASASLAQVHQAILTDGRRVALKVQHLDIEETAAVDLRTIRRILVLVGFFIRLRGLDAAYQQIKDMIDEELNFTSEADYIREIAANLKGMKTVACLEVVPEFCTRRILTTLFVDGIKVTDLVAIEAAGIDRKLLADRILNAYCQMFFRHGVYHADPHPGNILVEADGRIVFLDFGAVGRLSSRMKDGFPRFLEAALCRDSPRILETLRSMGFLAPHANKEDAVRIIAYFQGRFLERASWDTFSLNDIRMDIQTKMEMMNEMGRLDISVRDLLSTFQVPREWVMLQRTLLLLVGLTTHLDQALNPIKIVRPYLTEAASSNGMNWQKIVGHTIKDLFHSALTIPADFKRLVAKANAGELEVRVPGVRERTRLIYALGHQFLFGMLTLGSGILFFLARQGDDQMVANAAGKLGIFFTVCLGYSFLAARKWLR